MVVDPLVRGVGVAAAAASVATVGWLRRVDRRFVVVDAGSGATRVTMFGSSAWGSRVQVVAGPTRVSAKVCESLESRKSAEEFAGSVGDAVRALGGGKAPIFVGATAGARDALRRHEDKSVAIFGLRDALAAELRRPVHFEVLEPEAEAEYELAAVRYATGGAKGLGLLSGGGKSMQLANEDVVRSVALDAYRGRQLIESRGLAGATMHDWEVRRRITNALLGAKTTERFRGRVACIELAGEALENALHHAAGHTTTSSLKPRKEELTVTRAEALRALQQRKDALLAGDLTANARALTYTIHLYALIELAFHPNASFTLLPTLPRKGPKLSWPLGLYLVRRDHLFY